MVKQLHKDIARLNYKSLILNTNITRFYSVFKSKQIQDKETLYYVFLALVLKEQDLDCYKNTELIRETINKFFSINSINKTFPKEILSLVKEIRLNADQRLLIKNFAESIWTIDRCKHYDTTRSNIVEDTKPRVYYEVLFDFID